MSVLRLSRRSVLHGLNLFLTLQQLRGTTRLRMGGGDRDSGKGRGRLTFPLGAFGDACLLASNPQFRLYVSLCFLALFSHFLSNKKLGEKLQVQYKILPRTI